MFYCFVHLKIRSSGYVYIPMIRLESNVRNRREKVTKTTRNAVATPTYTTTPLSRMKSSEKSESDAVESLS